MTIGRLPDAGKTTPNPLINWVAGELHNDAGFN
jgi:hypothetical protein